MRTRPRETERDLFRSLRTVTGSATGIRPFRAFLRGRRFEERHTGTVRAPITGDGGLSDDARPNTAVTGTRLCATVLWRSEPRSW